MFNKLLYIFFELDTRLHFTHNNVCNTHCVCVCIYVTNRNITVIHEVAASAFSVISFGFAIEKDEEEEEAKLILSYFFFFSWM